MTNPRAKALLEEERYSELRALWYDTVRGSTSPADIEGVLAGAATDALTGIPMGHDTSARSRFTRQLASPRALGEFYYFAFELLRDYCGDHRSRRDNYAALSDSWRSDPFSVLTLNYDVLLELSIERSGGSWAQPPFTDGQGIPVVKVHGSVNWFNPGVGAFAFPNAQGWVDLFKQVAQFACLTPIWNRPLRIVRPRDVPKVLLTDLVRSATDYDLPALLPPLGPHKDYDQVQAYRDVWTQARHYLSLANKVVVIGSRIRAADSKLRQTLRESVHPGTTFVLVGGREGARDRLQECLPWLEKDEVTQVEDFDHYVDELTT